MKLTELIEQIELTANGAKHIAGQRFCSKVN